MPSPSRLKYPQWRNAYPPTALPEEVSDLDNLSNQLRTATLAVDDISLVSMPQVPIEKSPSKTNDGPSCDILLCLGCYHI